MPPLDFTGQGNGFQLPPELAAFAAQGGAAPMVQGLMQARGAPAPAPPRPVPPPVVPPQPVVSPPMGAGQNALLDAGAAMLENSGTPFGRSIGAGLAAGKAAFTATKDAAAERAYQQQMLDATARGWDEAERRGLVPPGTGDTAKTLPLAQQQKMLGDFLAPHPGIVADGGSAWNVQTGKWETPNPKPVPDKPDFTLTSPDGTSTRYNGNTGAVVASQKGPKPVAVSSDFRSAISAVSGGKTDDPTQLNIVLGLKPGDRTAMNKAWQLYIQARQAPQTANPPAAQIIQTPTGPQALQRGTTQARPITDATGKQVPPVKKGGLLDEIIQGATGGAGAPAAPASGSAPWVKKSDGAWYQQRPDGKWNKSATQPTGTP